MKAATVLFLLHAAVTATSSIFNAPDALLFSANDKDYDVPLPGYDRAADPDILPDDATLTIPNEAPFLPEVNGCNGYVKYCNKRLSQVLWMGAHNSLTDVGFAVQRNQFVDGPRLLDAGVRYFDIDTCAYMKHGQRVSPMVCHGDVWWRTLVYQPTHDGLRLIRAWMESHPREVIFLNFGDIDDFTALNDHGEATSTDRLRQELVPVLRSVFQDMVVLRNDPSDNATHADTATLQDLITANRRVVVTIGKGRSESSLYWSQDDLVCNGEWYPTSLQLDWTKFNYDWKPVYNYIDEHMRAPCQHTQVINKLEFEFHTALGGTIDSNHVGQALASYMQDLEANNGRANAPPYFPFNMVLTDHSDKWAGYYPQWHATHLRFLGD
ncbi:Aste57867_9130 [Aphanomyces stellatus]|uniref:Aste57867_9130 protein n=1 Tax=Aphanomyces stellatus TaxID=120398 RepID=A0A485KM77_9STRA|nr:hypothetical protein As57867_009094 [Aphanomyces stellatus]VFT86014.1 Aste57867_9130 [Aphanomyces stellatus]